MRANNQHQTNRRQFIVNTAMAAGAALLTSCSGLGSGRAARRRATDQVKLGRTGLRISRLGMGTGSDGGRTQRELGQQEFNRLVRYAYDQGITYFDSAQNYQTFEWLGDAIKGLPRERLFLQSKIGGQPEDVLKAIDRHRSVFQTDYIDSLLIHCMVKGQWTDEWKRIMDAYDQAKEKKWILAKGVSCHSLPALRAAAASDWNEVHLVRVNPQGRRVDGPKGEWDEPGNVPAVQEEIRTMHAKGHGVIGMKIIGNGDFTNPEDRERSIRFAMAQREIDAVVIGFKNTTEIDEAIERMDRALAETV